MEAVEISVWPSCRGDLLCGTPQRHGKKKCRSWRARNVGDTARLRKGERTVSTEWWRERHRKETRSWKGSTWTRTKTFFLHRWAGYIARSGTDGYTNSDGLKNRRSTMVERNTKKTQFEVERSIPEGVSLAGDGKRRSRSSKNTKTGCQQM